MTVPANVAFTTITGSWVSIVGGTATSLAGARILFAPRTDRLVANSGESPVVSLGTVTVTLDADGNMADGHVTLVSSVQADYEPTGWTWQITVLIANRQPITFDVELEAGATVDVAALVPLQSALGDAVRLGPQGESAMPVIPAGSMFVLATWDESVAAANPQFGWIILDLPE